MTTERFIYDSDSDPGMRVVEGGCDIRVDPRGVTFTISDDWMGDSETGFGAVVTCCLSPEQVAALHAALGRWLADSVLA